MTRDLVQKSGTHCPKWGLANRPRLWRLSVMGRAPVHWVLATPFEHPTWANRSQMELDLANHGLIQVSLQTLVAPQIHSSDAFAWWEGGKRDCLSSGVAVPRPLHRPQSLSQSPPAGGTSVGCLSVLARNCSQQALVHVSPEESSPRALCRLRKPAGQFRVDRHVFVRLRRTPLKRLTCGAVFERCRRPHRRRWTWSTE